MKPIDAIRGLNQEVKRLENEGNSVYYSNKDKQLGLDQEIIAQLKKMKHENRI